jgi:alpha,alpha-trehalase
MTQLNNLADQAEQNLQFFESELFKTVQMSDLYPDSKTFTDAIAKSPIKEIVTRYERQLSEDKDFKIVDFIKANFEIPSHRDVQIKESTCSIDEHIELLWQKLTKKADDDNLGSLLPLKRSYIVPGGRFREIYYWDSYFTALGLVNSENSEIAESMLFNFIDLQTHYDCIPNGNRTYYLSRSQPPILGLLTELLLVSKSNKTDFIQQCIDGIEKEYLYWMQGKPNLNTNNTEHKRVVLMPDGAVLNRYWDENNTPRPESYKEDIELYESLSINDKGNFYRNIRAACESGWDFSSRWLDESHTLASIKTTRIIPIDLNCLLYKNECLLSDYYSQLNQVAKSDKYAELAKQRGKAINNYMWSQSDGFYLDYDLDIKSVTKVKSIAGVLPLFVKLASHDQAKFISEKIQQYFLKSGGLVTTLSDTNQQWDAPNGWAPLQWFAVQGLINYDDNELAISIIERWTYTVKSYFEQTGKLMEKYNVCEENIAAQGGEYDVQEGFGWTNGVYKAFSVKLKQLF